MFCFLYARELFSLRNTYELVVLKLFTRFHVLGNKPLRNTYELVVLKRMQGVCC